MKKYIGTKVIMAEPMTMTKAQKVLGRELKSATLEEDGYLVEYKDGYKSWSPRSVFEGAYEDFYEMTSINFGGAIQALKIGLAVRRKLTFTAKPRNIWKKQARTKASLQNTLV